MATLPRALPRRSVSMEILSRGYAGQGLSWTHSPSVRRRSPGLGALFRPGLAAASGVRAGISPGPVSPTYPSNTWARVGQEAAMTSSPVSRVVYNGKRNSSPRSPSNSSEIFTPAHEENVRFIYEAWQSVERDLRSQMAGGERVLVEEYVEKVPNPSLKAFKPVDLSDLKRRNTQDSKKS